MLRRSHRGFHLWCEAGEFEVDWPWNRIFSPGVSLSSRVRVWCRQTRRTCLMRVPAFDARVW